MRTLSVFAVLTLITFQAETAVAQIPLAPPPLTPYGLPISIENAKVAAAAAMGEASSHGWAMAIAVVDPSGLLIYFEKMTNTQNASGDLAIEKARTSALFRRPTKAFQDALAAGGDNLRVLRLTGAMPNAGGIPIVLGGHLIGAIGVSGGSVDQDAQVAQRGAAAIK